MKKSRFTDEQNGFVKSFNGNFNDECLNETLLTSLDEARK